MWRGYMDCNVMWCLTFTHPWTSNRRKNATKYCLPLVVFILDEAILQRAKPYFILYRFWSQLKEPSRPNEYRHLIHSVLEGI